MTGGEAVVRALSEHGVELLFGIPGTHTLELHRHLSTYGIRHVTPRHEAGGGLRRRRLRADQRAAPASCSPPAARA